MSSRGEFGQIYDYITDNKRCPQLATGNTRIIQEWMLAGYDFEKDIKPAVDHCTRYGGRTIKGYGFFHTAVQKNYEARMSAPKPIEQTQAEKDASRAKHLRWVKDKDLKLTSVGPRDFVWLEQYEQQHGGSQV